MKYKISKNMTGYMDFCGKSYKEFLDFAINNSDMISLSIPAVLPNEEFNYEEVLIYLAPEIIAEVLYTELTSETHCTKIIGGSQLIPVLNFSFTKKVKSFLFRKGSFFNYQSHEFSSYLDDLAFYYNGTCWLSTCTHELIFRIDSDMLRLWLNISK